MASEGCYAIRVRTPAHRALTETLSTAVAAAAWELINGPIRENPRRAGTPLRFQYEGRWSARRGEYRIIYEIDDTTRTVTILAVRGRADAYR